MATLVVGDLHGKLEVAEAALSSPYNVIFMGDYLDSFDRTVEEQIETLALVLDAATDTPDRVQALMGNHELSYLYPSMRASGYKGVTQLHVDVFKEKMLEVLKPYIWHQGYLLSHAGVGNTLLQEEQLSLKAYLETKEFFDIGVIRGGRDFHGGLYWADYYYELVPVPGVKQIVGHTGYAESDVGGVRKMKGSRGGVIYNVDNLDRINTGLLLREGMEPTEIVITK